MSLRALFLDFGNTLVHEVPSRFELYAREARALGVEIDESAMHGLMHRAAAELPARIGGDYRYTDGWFEAYIERIFHGELGLGREELGPLRARLFEVFSDAATFALFPGARELLSAARAAGLAVGLISNWSPRLPGILDGMGLTDSFDTVLCSAIEQCEKPEPEIFERALARTGVRAADALHAGDHPQKDCAGALAAGMQAVLVDHAGSMQAPGGVQGGVPRVTSLFALRDHVLSRPQPNPS